MAVAVGLSLAGDLAVVVAQPERGRVAPTVLWEPAVALADVAAPVEAATKAQPPPMISKRQQEPRLWPRQTKKDGVSERC